MEYYLNKAIEPFTADVIKELHALRQWKYQSPPAIHMSQRAENTQRLLRVMLSESMFHWWIQGGRLPLAKVNLLKWHSQYLVVSVFPNSSCILLTSSLFANDKRVIKKLRQGRAPDGTSNYPENVIASARYHGVDTSSETALVFLTQ